MAEHTNFTLRDQLDTTASNIAIAAVLKTLLSKSEDDLDIKRVRQLVGSAAGEDNTNLIDRAMWFVQWMNGQYDEDDGGRREGDDAGLTRFMAQGPAD